MPDDAYTTTGGGLKLKGGVKKPKKKKKRTETSDAAVSALVNAVQVIDEAVGGEANTDTITPVEATGEPRVPADQAVGGEDKPPRETYVKTEAELRHEERKRRQVGRFLLVVARPRCTDTWDSSMSGSRRKGSRRTRNAWRNSTSIFPS